MCLFIKRVKPRIAKFNIPVYKILGIKNCHLQTPFAGVSVNLKQPLIAYHAPIIHYSCYDNVLRIDEGVIHCFWNKYSARKYLKGMKAIFDYSFNFIIQKAYIPKGTSFFIGRGKSFGEIGAERIIFKL